MIEKYKILAVDDNPINLKLLSSALISSDYKIYTASSGKEALNLVRSVLPDLILLDVMMPDMDGYQVCKKLQESEETRFIPVIFLSARNDAMDKAKGLAMGAVDYLTKPFNPLEISARVRTHLSARKAIISLMRKNQELQRELQNLKAKNLEAEENLFKYLQKLDANSFHLKENLYQFFSLAKSKLVPITRNTIPVFSSDTLLVLLHFNGFNKDHQTLMIKFLVQNFLEGYFLNPVSQKLDVDNLNALFLFLLEKFSPDIYQVAFTFGLSCIDFNTREIIFYGLQLNEPLVIFPNGQSVPLAGKLIEVESELKSFINASQSKIEPGQWIVWYHNDSKPATTQKVKEVINDALETCNSDLQQFVLLLDQQIEPGEQDVSFSVLQIG